MSISSQIGSYYINSSFHSSLNSPSTCPALRAGANASGRDIIPPLSHLCIERLASQGFNEDVKERLPPDQRAHYLSLLPVTEPLDVPATHVTPDISYWTKRLSTIAPALARTSPPSEHCRLTFETLLVTAATTGDRAALEETLSAGGAHVRQFVALNLPLDAPLDTILALAPNLETLDIVWTVGAGPVPLSAMRSLAGALPRAQALREVRITSSLLTDAHVAILAPSLRSVRVLDLSANVLTGRGAQTLAGLAGASGRLHTLVLHGNPLGDAQAVPAMASYSSQSALRVLDVGGCGLSDRACAETVQALSSGSARLQTLVLRDNRAGNQTAVALSKVLRSNMHLHTLNVRGSAAFADGLLTLRGALSSLKEAAGRANVVLPRRRILFDRSCASDRLWAELSALCETSAPATEENDTKHTASRIKSGCSE